MHCPFSEHDRSWTIEPARLKESRGSGSDGSLVAEDGPLVAEDSLLLDSLDSRSEVTCPHDLASQVQAEEPLMRVLNVCLIGAEHEPRSSRVRIRFRQPRVEAALSSPKQCAEAVPLQELKSALAGWESLDVRFARFLVWCAEVRQPRVPLSDNGIVESLVVRGRQLPASAMGRNFGLPETNVDSDLHVRLTMQPGHTRRVADDNVGCWELAAPPIP